VKSHRVGRRQSLTNVDDARAVDLLYIQGRRPSRGQMRVAHDSPLLVAIQCPLRSPRSCNLMSRARLVPAKASHSGT